MNIDELPFVVSYAVRLFSATAVSCATCLCSELGWPQSCMYTVYDRIFGDFPAKSTVYTPCKCMVLANPNFKSYSEVAALLSVLQHKQASLCPCRVWVL